MSKRHRQNIGPMVNLNDLMEILRRNGLLQNNAIPQNQQGNHMAPPLQGFQGQQGNLGPFAGLLGGSNPMMPTGNAIPPMMPMGMPPGQHQKTASSKDGADDREILKNLLSEIIAILKEDENKD